MKLNHILFFSFLSVLFNQVLTLNILGVFPYEGKSHFFVFAPYLKELARRGHNLTVVSYFPLEKPMENYHDISLSKDVKILEDVFPIKRSYWTIIQISFFLINSGTENCKTLLDDENVQNLWKSKQKFDLVVTEQFNSDCALGLAHALGAPVVGLTSCVIMPWHYEAFGIQYNPAHVPILFLEGGTKPTLYQRIERTILHLYFVYLHKLTCRKENDKTLAKYFKDIPPVDELAQNVNMLLSYSHNSITGPILLPPNVKEVGGYHVAKPKELPKDLKKFIDEAEHGVIYISFGSMLRATSTPKDKLEAIIGAISELPQRIVWKWEEKNLPGNPKNVFISNWLPQNDILAHPKVLAFYSHCGMLGTTEAIYHGVPMIGMPIFGDQPGNAGAIEESGLGVQIDIRHLTKELLLEKFKIVLNPEFRRKVKDLSRVWHDRPQTAMDSAIYWTEYTARTANYSFGTPAAKLPIYIFRSWDIIAVLGTICLAILISLKLVITFLYKKLTQKPKIKTNASCREIGQSGTGGHREPARTSASTLARSTLNNILATPAAFKFTMKPSALIVTLLSLLVLTDYACSLNILGIFPYHGKSHFIVFRVFLRELAKRGHNVTVISHFPEQDPPTNYHDISLAGSIKAIEGEAPFESSYFTLFLVSLYLATTGVDNCKVLLADDKVQRLIKEKPKFDVIVVEQFNSDCALGIAYKFQAPVVGIMSHILMPYHYERLGVPYNPAYVPFHFLEGGTKPSLYHRVERTIFDFYFRMLNRYYTQRSNQNTLAQYFDDIPPLEELGREIKFLLLYHNFILTGSRLFPSNVIEVGGFHVVDAKPLTGDLKKFVEEAEHGVIYISFGSIVKASTMPAEKVQEVLNVMKQLPQRFVWKWEDKTLMVDKDKLYTNSWLPQVDILAHPKTLAFLSHAGNGGTTEAIHYGVPMVAMPVGGDQPANAAAIEESGLGVQLQIRDLNQENLLNAFKKVLDPKFRQRVKEVSKAWHDRPLSPLDTAVYWTEFAAKYPNFNFRTAAADVPFYQYINLDVAAVFITIISLILIALRTALKVCCGRKESKGKNTKSNKVEKKKPKRA
nr:uncharacterized protein LOC110384519 [Helicoverpa armigera]